MDCPACSRSLAGVDLGGLHVDVCREGCAGVWFDNFEVSKVDEGHEAAGEPLLDYQPRVELEMDKAARRQCPVDGTIMMRHFFSGLREVEVDTCPACNGVWLDAGELAQLRQQTEAGRDAATEETIREQFGPALASMRAESREQLERSRSVARVLRWICPSYWIPGDQRGGAF